MFKIKTFTTVAIMCALVLTACDKKADDAPQKEEAQTPPSISAEPSTEPAKDEPAAEEEKKDEVDPKEVEKAEEDIEHEVDPSATEGLEDIDFSGKILTSDDQLKDIYKGEVKKSVSWKDKYGQQVFLMTFEEQKNGGGLIKAVLANQEGDGSWSVTREFKELVSSCEFDLVMTPKLDQAWSLTDLNKDGLGEVTFGWVADCTSDVSPLTFKVMMADGDKKYAIRGNTKVNVGKDGDGKTVYQGGEQKVDPAFDKAPEGFLAHAKKAWDANVVQYP